MNLKVKEYDRSYYVKVEEELQKRGFVHIGSGSYRNTYKRGNIVVKVPRHWDGFDDNIGEAYAWRKYRNNPKVTSKKDYTNGIVFAPSRLLPNGCLMMVLVQHVKVADLPEWAQNIDGCQAGRYKDRIVAFDAGCDLGFDKNEALVALGLPETD